MKLSRLYIYKFAAFVLGVFVGGLCLLMGFLIAGAGHGWGAAFPFGIAALLLTPLAFVRLLRFRSTSLVGNISFFAVAILLDLLLLWSTWQEGFAYFNKARPYAIQWLGVWSIWQFATALTLILTLRTKKSE